MKTIKLKSVILLLLVFGIQLGNAQDNKSENALTKESIVSFYKVLNVINWKDYDEVGGMINRNECQSELKEILKNIPLTPIPIKDQWLKTDFAGSERALRMFTATQKALDENDFADIEKPNNPFLVNPTRDEILGSFKLDEQSSLEKFNNDVKGNGRYNGDEEKAVETIYKAYFSRYTVLMDTSFVFKNCKINQSYRIQPKKIDILNEKIHWEMIRRTKVECGCAESEGSKDLDNGVEHLWAMVSSSFQGKKLNDIRFLSNAKPTLYERFTWCCPEKDKNDEKLKQDDGDTGDGINDGKNENKDSEDKGDEKDDHGYNPQNSTNQNCCDLDNPKNAVAISPGIALDENFKNVGYDVALQYMRDFGKSFKNDHIYGGAFAGYMNTESQDGDINNSQFYVGAKFENRSPISCSGDVKWVNGISAQYGIGNIKSFDIKDKYNSLSFSFYTGANIQLSNSFSIGADINVFQFGKITYKPDNRPEIKEDIGEVRLNKNNIVDLWFAFMF